jgi:hypothetical protein
VGLTELRRQLSSINSLSRALRTWRRDENDRRATGFAVLAMWGTSERHDVFGFTPDWDSAVRLSRRKRRAWARPGPYPRPEFAVVAATRFEVRAHGSDGCRRPDCRWTLTARASSKIIIGC